MCRAVAGHVPLVQPSRVINSSQATPKPESSRVPQASPDRMGMDVGSLWPQHCLPWRAAPCQCVSWCALTCHGGDQACTALLQLHPSHRKPPAPAQHPEQPSTSTGAQQAPGTEVRPGAASAVPWGLHLGTTPAPALMFLFSFSYRQPSSGSSLLCLPLSLSDMFDIRLFYWKTN